MGSDSGDMKQRTVQIVNKFPLWKRNLPCPCGSGKKFKRCHYAKRQKRAVTFIVHSRG